LCKDLRIAWVHAARPREETHAVRAGRVRCARVWRTPCVGAAARVGLFRVDPQTAQVL